tara:strand:- start:786 stop:1607 length:822 start_codon:yes stop_codon:yes gene_type:complete
MYKYQYYDVYAVIILLTVLGVFEIIIGTYGHKSNRKQNDWLLEIVSSLQLFIIIKPFVFPLTAVFIFYLLPFNISIVADSFNILIMLSILIGDDFLQYWYHRMAHKWDWLWNLHKPHHTAEEMGVLVSYRNAFLYYIFMPNIWLLGFVTHLGFYNEVVISIIIKQIVVAAAHSAIKWDQILYSNKLLNPFAYIIERLISTPSTHFSHHGKDESDGISNPNGNFSNLFFFWDIIFGTSLITRKYPNKFGIKDDLKESWYYQLYYPFIKQSQNNK